MVYSHSDIVLCTVLLLLLTVCSSSSSSVASDEHRFAVARTQSLVMPANRDSWASEGSVFLYTQDCLLLHPYIYTRLSLNQRQKKQKYI